MKPKFFFLLLFLSCNQEPEVAYITPGADTAAREKILWDIPGTPDTCYPEVDIDPYRYDNLFREDSRPGPFDLKPYLSLQGQIIFVDFETVLQQIPDSQ